DALEQAAKDEAARLGGNPHNLDPDQLGVTSGLKNANISIRAMQQMLRDNPDLTTEQFLVKDEQEVRREVAKQNQPAVFKMITDQYTALVQKYGDILPDAAGLTPQKMHEDFLTDKNKDSLKALEEYDMNEVVDFVGKKPISTFTGLKFAANKKDK